jgi:hypothetical protein
LISSLHWMILFHYSFIQKFTRTQNPMAMWGTSPYDVPQKIQQQLIFHHFTSDNENLQKENFLLHRDLQHHKMFHLNYHHRRNK